MRSVIVTGGSRGLGLGIARKLAGEGYRVIALARNETSQLRSAMGDSFHFVPFDLAQVDDIAALVKTVRKNFGPIYGLVNNAAVSFGGALSLMHNSKIEQMVRLNALSPIVLTKYVVRSMMADGGGRIVKWDPLESTCRHASLSIL